MVGFWTEDGLKHLPEGDVTYDGVPRRAYVIKKGNRKIGVMRYRHGDGWIVNLQGFRFATVPGKGAHRFGLSHTISKLFPTREAVNAALEWAFKNAEERKNGMGTGTDDVHGSGSDDHCVSDGDEAGV